MAPGGATIEYIALGNEPHYPLVSEPTHGGHSALKGRDSLTAYSFCLVVDGPFLVQIHYSHV